MWSSSRRVLQDLVSTYPSLGKSFSVTACRNTVIVERVWQVPLAKEGRPATSRLYPRRHRIYKLVEDTTHSPKEKMELILTQTVPKLGGRGDIVLVKKSVGRNKLLPQGLAVYSSPENKAIFAEELRLLREGKAEERLQTRTGQLTVDFLKRSSLKINLNPPMADFELTKEIVSRQFLRKLGVVAPPHTLRLPDEPIKELGDYWCDVTVNGLDTVRVPMSLMPYEDRRLRKKDQEVQPEVAASSTAEAAVSEAGKVVVVDMAAPAAAEAHETPLAEASVQPEASAAPPLKVASEATASLETPPVEAPVPPEASAAPPAEVVASLEAEPVEASAAPPAEVVASLEAEPVEASAAPPAEVVASLEAEPVEASAAPPTASLEAEPVEASAAPPTASLEAEPVEVSAAPPAEPVEASVTSEASAAPPDVSVSAETASNDPTVLPNKTKKD